MEKGKFNRAQTNNVGRINTLVYLPTKYNSDKKYPTICFLHGSGEGGTDIDRLLTQGLPWVYNEHIKNGTIADTDLDKFIMIAIQAGNTSVDPASLARALFELKEVINIDTNRIYCTGLSAGGNRTIEAVQAFPNLFAAVAPMSCGQWWNNLHGFQDVHAWFMHGLSDRLAAFSRSVRHVNMINDLYPGNAVLKAYKGGHGFWKEHYEPSWRWTSENALPQDIGQPNGLNLYDWFLQYTKADYVAPSKDEKQWKVEYWNTPGAIGPDTFYYPPLKTEMASRVNFNWGAGSPTGIDTDQFAARFTRTMKLPAGQYKLTLISDDGAKAIVDKKLEINIWGYHNTKKETAIVDLSSGFHTFEVDYFEAHGDAQCKFSIERIGDNTPPVDHPEQPEDPVERIITKVTIEYSDGTQEVVE